MERVWDLLDHWWSQYPEDRTLSPRTSYEGLCGSETWCVPIQPIAIIEPIHDIDADGIRGRSGQPEVAPPDRRASRTKNRTCDWSRAP